MTLDLFAYSERGMVNALVYELLYSEDNLALLQELLQLCWFPLDDRNDRFTDLQEATLMVEQSFSKFGDLDLLVLLKNGIGQRHSIFIEAKVKTDQSHRWSLIDEWMKFAGSLNSRTPSSNLFIQLYRKMRLVRRLTEGTDDAVDSRWRLGQNRVVRDAAKRLEPYCDEPWFVGLVPVASADVRYFWNEHVSTFSPEDTLLPDWTKNQNRIGFVSWNDVHQLCTSSPDRWPRTLANFDYNKGQIYGAEEMRMGKSSPFRAGDRCEFTDEAGNIVQVQIVRRGSSNSRVRPLLDTTKTFLVSNDRLRSSLN